MAPTQFMAERLFTRISGAGIALRFAPYAVNIGCGDGRSQNDPVYPLYCAGFRGLAIDGHRHPGVDENLGPFGITIRQAFVSPSNIVGLMKEGGCPPNPEFLKMDIDGVDAPVLKAILSVFRPLAIQAEVNSEIPPPLGFTVCYHPEYQPGSASGFFGCSLTYVVDLLRPLGYALVELDFDTNYTHDGLFVRREMLNWNLGLAEIDARTAFLAARPVIPHVEVPDERKLAWRQMTDFTALRAEIWSALLEANRKKHGHDHVPFELYISG